MVERSLISLYYAMNFTGLSGKTVKESSKKNLSSLWKNKKKKRLRLTSPREHLLMVEATVLLLKL